MHSQLRNNQKIHCQRFEKEKGCEGNHPERSDLVGSTFLPDASTVAKNLDNEQRGCGHRCRQKQRHQDAKRGVRAIPSAQQIESSPHEQ